MQKNESLIVIYSFSCLHLYLITNDLLFTTTSAYITRVFTVKSR